MSMCVCLVREGWVYMRITVCVLRLNADRYLKNPKWQQNLLISKIGSGKIWALQLQGNFNERND